MTTPFNDKDDSRQTRPPHKRPSYKKMSYLVALVVLICAGIVLTQPFGKNLETHVANQVSHLLHGTPATSSDKNRDNTSDKDGTNGADKTEANSASGNSSDKQNFSPEQIVPAYINSVHDGDTVHATGPQKSHLKIRLIGIDSPEVNDPDTADMGKQARNHLKELIYHKDVYLKFDQEPTDTYGRLLAYIWLKDPQETGEDHAYLVNELMIRDGFAEILPVRPNVLYRSQFEQAQNQARTSQAGLWKNGDFRKRALGKAH